MARANITLTDKVRGRGGEFRAILTWDSTAIGYVERGWNQSGRRSDEYVAKVARTTVAEARTLADLISDLREPETVEEIRTLLREREL